MEYLRHPGSKFGLAKWIISHFPPHECFVDVFGGTGAVLIKKEPSKVEIFNDIDFDLVNLLMVIKESPKELAEELMKYPYSRGLYEKFLSEWREGVRGDNNFERAVRFYYLKISSFSGTFLAGFSRSAYCKVNEEKSRWMNRAKEHFEKIQVLEDTAERFEEVLIEQKDFREIIELYDSPTTLFYCDPPYENIRKSEKKQHAGKAYYRTDFNKKDNSDLAALLSQIKGKTVVSGYHGVFDELYKNWYSEEKEVVVTASATIRPRVMEVLWMNFNPKEEDIFVNGKIKQKRLFE